MSSLLMKIEPSVGVSNPPMRFSRVDLPEPEGPTRVTKEPSFIFRFISKRALVKDFPEMNFLETLFRWIIVEIITWAVCNWNV